MLYIIIFFNIIKKKNLNKYKDNKKNFKVKNKYFLFTK